MVEISTNKIVDSCYAEGLNDARQKMLMGINDLHQSKFRLNPARVEEDVHSGVNDSGSELHIQILQRMCAQGADPNLALAAAQVLKNKTPTADDLIIMLSARLSLMKDELRAVVEMSEMRGMTDLSEVRAVIDLGEIR